MKIISDCPYCNKDFMYDPNFDTHLIREIKVLNDKTGKKRTRIFICQECDEQDNKNYLKE